MLHNIYDIQRLSTRLSNTTANPSDFFIFITSLYNLPDLIKISDLMGLNVFDEVKSKIKDLMNSKPKTLDFLIDEKNKKIKSNDRR